MKNLDPETKEEAIVADRKCCGNGKRCEKTEKVVVAVAAARLIAYKDCRRNHAASIGGHAVDGCCEFMAAGEAGSSTAFICAACNCHRNFHRKVVIWRSHQASSSDHSSVSTSAKC